VKKHKSKYVVGLMSGTSADGIDAVVAEISGGGLGLKVRLVAQRQQAFSGALREKILRISLHGTVAEICELNFELGGHFAKSAAQVIRKAGLKLGDVALIGSHGQTVHHLPGARLPSTLQIGEPAVIAERTGITTVADFRVRDVAAGGQGAPLVPYVDWVMHTDKERPRILQNIGGIGNLTFLPPKAGLEQVRAFDTGPGNMVIDAVAGILSHGRLRFDRNGAWAARGKVNEKLLKELMRHPFIRRSPPKTTGREEFGEEFVARLMAQARRTRLADEDVLATATAFTAESMADCYRRFVMRGIPRNKLPLLQIILGGGGAKNSALLRMLAERVAPAAVLTQDDLGWSNSAKEALAFAVLAHETVHGRPANVPSATGARRAVVLGKIVPGRSRPSA